MADGSYERVLLVKPEAFVYQIPPRTSTTRAVRAAEWDLPNPNWRGRMRIIAKGDQCIVKLEDKISGELFAMCPVDAHPGVAVEPVSDSSRYFVLRLADPSGRHAFVGMGFEDRGDAFDFNVTLQDHFKQVKQSQELAKEDTKPFEHKDYSLKQGQKIHISLGKKSEESGSTNKPKSTAGIGMAPGGGLLPPPAANVARPLNPPPPSKPKQDDWGDFSSFESGNSSSSGGNNWVQF